MNRSEYLSQAENWLNDVNEADIELESIEMLVGESDENPVASNDEIQNVVDQCGKQSWREELIERVRNHDVIFDCFVNILDRF
jgi:hypothetical protein